MHLLTHYTRVMLLNGPVVHYSSMKYERKNRTLKEVASGTTFSTNLPLTIAIRHQLQQCFITEFCSNTHGDDVMGPIDESNAQTSLRKLVPSIKKEMPVVTLKNIEILGKPYSVGTIIAIRISEEGPQFGIVKKIFSCDNIYIQAKELDTLYFNDYYHAYSVSSNVQKPDVLINVDLVPRLPPCLLVIKSKEELVIMRYDI